MTVDASATAVQDCRMGFPARPSTPPRAPVSIRSDWRKVFPLIFLAALICPIPAVADSESEGSFGDDAQVSQDIEEILAGPDFRRLRVEVPAPQQKAETKMPEWLEK